MRCTALLLLCLFALTPARADDPPNFGSKKEVLTINTDQYEVSIQKNGRTDLRLVAGAHIFDDIVPLLRLEGDTEDRALRTRWQQTMRTMVSDVLGEGQGIVFGGDDFEWHLNTYPGKPYLSARLVYINAGKAPVRLARLSPWSVGTAGAGGLSLGEGTRQAFILDNGHLFRGFDDYAGITRGSAFSNWNIALFNPNGGRSVIAGFLSNHVAYTEFEVRPGDDPKLDRVAFRADCYYDPPKTVAPGERVASETLYLAVTEQDPLLALERFAKGQALWNKKPRRTGLIPHGWDSWSTSLHRNIDEPTLRQDLDALDKHLKRYGWNHFAIDAGWERGRGDWEPHPERFPNGLKPLVDDIHARGMTAGLWIDPFTLGPDAPLVQQHPEWLVRPSGPGLLLVGMGNFVLDVTAPGAEDYVRGLAQKISHTWGFDALVEADFVYNLLMAERYHDAGVTKIEAFRRGMLALREGMGPDKFIMSMTPQPVNGAIVDGIRVGRDNKPLWRLPSRLENGAAVDALASAARRWYLGTHLYVADQDCAFFGHESSRKRWNTANEPALTWDQSVAWLTGTALTGGAVKIGERFSELQPREIDVLRRLLPAPPRAARPIDLFQESEPRIWHLPLKTDAGQWDLVGVFNWDEQKEAVIAVPLDALNLDPRAYHTVYDFWPQQYLGTAQTRLEVKVPAGSVRLLGLRRLQPEPMLIASDRHYTQGALDHTAITWDPATRVLEGRFDAVNTTPYAITVSVPEGYAPTAANWSGGSATLSPDKTSARIQFTTGAEQGGPATWRVQF